MCPAASSGRVSTIVVIIDSSSSTLYYRHDIRFVNLRIKKNEPSAGFPRTESFVYIDN